MPAPRAWVSSHRFTDAHDLACALHDAGVEYIPLQDGPFETTYRALALGSVTVQRVEDKPHVVRWAVEAGRAILLLPIALAGPAMINGWTIGTGDALLTASGMECHGLCPAPVDWAGLSLPLGRMAGLLDLAGLPDPGTALLRMPRATALRLQRTVARATDLVATLPPGALGPRLAATLADAVDDALLAAFAAAEPAPPVPRATREAMRILHRAEEVLAANRARPVYTEELCATLEVSPRTLHKAFVATCGMSPQAFLKRRRLMLVHAALKAEGPQPPLVKSVALDHGFWHLGHFSQAYRALFGCSPSETAALSRHPVAAGRAVPPPTARPG